MPIIVQEASDADIPRACEIEVAAYATNEASPFLFPGPFPPDSQQQRANLLISDRRKDPTIRYIKAIDQETGQQIAFAKWHIYDSVEAAAKAERALNFGPGCNKPACLAFFGGLARRKKEIMGDKPHVYLHLLHTDPKFQGRGAGGGLVKWGQEQADKLGLPIYLESSPSAHRFYQKHGFQDVEQLSLNLSEFGGDKLHITPLMIREPGGDQQLASKPI
ncbi:acyl-CoA N-acyltransferase [Lojkania enalia]|uniref:Acyl-CoA N-acyltransferase n=1 Tax=Lojkania enalia TaxID=147567 RepID=A0A9P4K491_9PLEO|nr:acyl-CoA N-acyltransferase [Didymosphaeria enalia]